MCTNIYFWNVRGINEPDKHRPFCQWISTHKPLLGALLETHIKEPNLPAIMTRLCPGWSHVSNHDTDFDGRIIIIWKFPAAVEVMHQSRQSMTCNVSLPGDKNFTFTAVYASNLREERESLWEELYEVQTTLFLENKNWLIGGDLNLIMHHCEHSSPSVDHLTHDMLELRNNLNQIGVSDLRFQGCDHIWTNKCPSAPVTKKLDRALINDRWLENFPHSVASFLAHEFSDHSPCLIDLACPLPQAGTKPFKFQNFLPQHLSFLQVVESTWIESGSKATNLSTLGFKIKGLKRALKTLARDNFSDIQKRVTTTNSLLKDVQVKCLNQANETNFQAEKDLLAHWMFLRRVEEAFFKQKSRINWLRLGDQNTLFFMRVAASRNSYNSIRSLQLPCGLLVTDSVELCEIALAHFQSVLSPAALPPLVSPFQWFLDLIPFRCSVAQKLQLSTMPDDSEISRTLLKLNPNKAPGPDGFTSAFFKAAWSLVGEETMDSIRNFFVTAFLPSTTNATLLTLVPKRPGASRITDYRPISCCNTSYKAISKILVKRLKVIFPEVILPNQTAFVQGRLLIENTLIASEIVQDYHKEGGPQRITIKVDIAKAFDTIRWEFIFQCLRCIAVPESLIRWIEACVCSATFSLGFNGSSYGYFRGSRGLRQGDPLSPYLFVLAMNCLSHSLNKAAKEGKFNYHSKCKRTELTHLSFADDLLIFSDGSPRSVNNILEVLRDFEARSGLRISMEKTSLYAAGLKPHELAQLTAATGLSLGVLPVRYLGVPLCTKKLTMLHCAPLLLSIKSKLHSWTVKSLSLAGRLQLLSTVIAGITNFWSWPSFSLKPVSMRLTPSAASFFGRVKLTVQLRRRSHGKKSQLHGKKAVLVCAR